MTGEVYIHYGADAFDPSHGFPVANTKYSWAKPYGGLWAVSYTHLTLPTIA